MRSELDDMKERIFGEGGIEARLNVVDVIQDQHADRIVKLERWAEKVPGNIEARVAKLEAAQKAMSESPALAAAWNLVPIGACLPSPSERIDMPTDRELEDAVERFRAARAVREGQNEPSPEVEASMQRDDEARDAAIRDASPPAFARETPSREAVKALADEIASHCAETTAMRALKSKDMELVLSAWIARHMRPSPPPETRTDAIAEANRKTEELIKAFQTDNRQALGDPTIYGAVPPAQPPKRETMPNEYEIAAEILNASEHEMSGADNLRAARAVKALVSEHVARVEQDRDEWEAKAKKLAAEVEAFGTWLDAAAEARDAGIPEGESASQGSLALTAAILKFSEIIAGPDPDEPSAESHLEECDKLRDRLKAECERLRAERDEAQKPLPMAEAARAMVQELAPQLDEMGAENYVEVGVGAPDGRRYAFRMQRCEGLSPHEKRREAETERDAALARAEAAEKKLEEAERDRDEHANDARMLRSRVDRLAAPAPDEAIVSFGVPYYEHEGSARIGPYRISWDCSVKDNACVMISVANGPVLEVIAERQAKTLADAWLAFGRPSPAVGRGVTVEMVADAFIMVGAMTPGVPFAPMTVSEQLHRFTHRLNAALGVARKGETNG